MSKIPIVSNAEIENKIFRIKGLNVMLDSDLAELYGVETRVLNQAVNRNIARFPPDFMFQLNASDWLKLRGQYGNNTSWGGRRKLPLVFTEHGVLMLSSVLNSDRAVQVNIQIMRIYTKLREMIVTHQDVLLKLEQLERKVGKHDQDIQLIFSALKQLLNEPRKPRPEVGFKRKDQ